MALLGCQKPWHHIAITTVRFQLPSLVSSIILGKLMISPILPFRDYMDQNCVTNAKSNSRFDSRRELSEWCCCDLDSVPLDYPRMIHGIYIRSSSSQVSGRFILPFDPGWICHDPTVWFTALYVHSYSVLPPPDQHVLFYPHPSYRAQTSQRADRVALGPQVNPTPYHKETSNRKHCTKGNLKWFTL